ncbi:MAG: winged helix-turn-helix domain-containing protein [Lewinellaceae bacterium]|nr:winged helix-turn-helix domain-containing protein [Lewinellaceae bacterium]
MMIHLDDDTVKRLRVLQRAHKDKRVFVKVTVLLMLHQGCTPQFVAESLVIDDSTVYRYRQGFEEFGLEDYLKAFFMAYSGQLTQEEEQQLLVEVRQGLYINSKQVAAYIQREFGIRCSLSAVVKLLRRLGFPTKKTKGVGVKSKSRSPRKHLCRN